MQSLKIESRLTPRLMAGVFALCLAAGSISVANAAPITQAATINTEGTLNTGISGVYTVGWSFTLGGSFLVDRLGYYEPSGGNNSSSHEVGIYKCVTSACATSTGSALVSGTVSDSDPLQGNFHWVTVAGVTLSAGDYVIAGVSHEESYQYSGNQVSFDPLVTWHQGRYEEGSTLEFLTLVNPDSNSPTYSYFGPNFGTDAGTVPEPASLALLGFGLAGLGFSRRRKQKAA